MAQVFNDILDNRLLTYLRREINKRPQYYYRLKHLACCGTKIIHNIGGGGVHLISNGSNAKLIGLKRCDNSWCCPVCSAREMSKHSGRIGAGIEALAKEGLVPIMITFTVMHTAKDSANDILELISKTYEGFNKNARWKKKYTNKITRKGKVMNCTAGEEKTYASAGAWNAFNMEFEIKHTIKVMEVTYGKHGWHPHLHNLYFIKRKDLSRVISEGWEEKLRAQWREYEDRESKKIFSAERYEERKKYYAKSDRKYKAQGKTEPGLYISKDETGTARAMKSSDYICGWGGDSELTGTSLKVAAKGHYTLPQLLRAAYENNDNKLLEKYLEFCEAVIQRRQHRIDYSRTGLNKIIKDYQRTEEYKEVIRKKNTRTTDGKITPYHTVAYIKKETWYEILIIEEVEDAGHLIPLMLALTNYENGYELICELFDEYKIPHPERKAPLVDYADLYNQMIMENYGITA